MIRNVIKPIITTKFNKHDNILLQNGHKYEYIAKLKTQDQHHLKYNGTEMSMSIKYLMCSICAYDISHFAMFLGCVVFVQFFFAGEALTIAILTF